MESSSNDSFLWTDASNDSSGNKSENALVMEPSANCKRSKRSTNFLSENETKKAEKTSKKRKYTESTNESCDYSQSEKKRIKVEPESDVDFEKKSMLKKAQNEKDTQDFISNGDEYLNLRVKEEQSSLLQSKEKKKKKKSYSSTDNVYKSESNMEQNKESDLDLRVKQEQESVTEPESLKSKKKKKRIKPFESSDIDTVSETKSLTTLGENNGQEDSLIFSEPSNYTVIEEKFCAEETVVERRRKKKHKVNTGTVNSELDNDSVCIKENTRITTETDNYDLTLQPSDFTCNNIVSSTIINSSSVDIVDNQINKMDELSRSKNIKVTKISDRIRFEDDNSSQQGSLFDRSSATTTMFYRANPHLKPCALETANDNLFTKDDEFWTLMFPHEIDLDKLRNSTVSSEGKHKIKIDGTSYELVPNEDEASITLLTRQHGQALITNLPVINCIKYHKRIPKVHIPDHNIMVNNQTSFIPLPETKCRHPLFGARYKKAIKISPAVVERLHAAKGQCSETADENIEKKKKRKNKHKLLSVKMEQDCEAVKQENDEPLMKNKKRKHSQDINSVPKKRKRVKHNIDSSTVWESEKAIEENLFNF